MIIDAHKDAHHLAASPASKSKRGHPDPVAPAKAAPPASLRDVIRAARERQDKEARPAAGLWDVEICLSDRVRRILHPANLTETPAAASDVIPAGEDDGSLVPETAVEVCAKCSSIDHLSHPPAIYSLRNCVAIWPMLPRHHQHRCRHRQRHCRP
jgi:hypothetical protein